MTIRGLLLALLLVACSTGCAGRQQMAARCAWPAESRSTIHLETVGDLQRHLRADARAAEMLAVQYADSKRGFKGPGEHRRATEQCEAALFGEIARLHHVAAEQVTSALRRQNDTPW